MKRTLAIVAVVVVAFAALAAVQRELTPEESAAITTYITAREATQRSRFSTAQSPERAIQMQFKSCRRPCDLCREYERVKINIPNWKPGDPSQRWLQRPKFPGWDDPCYTWHSDGKYYGRQLSCTKCKGTLLPGSREPIGDWINPNGYTCSVIHPLPIMDQWSFTVRLIATDHKKSMEAKAHVWNAHEHGELTDAQHDELMGVIDAAPPPE